jgi:L-ascorbate metabolism protein UlaG (beta-lactamase superfamily)
MAMLFCGTIPLYLLKGQDMVTYKMNPDLLIVKPDWKGNIVINGKYQNDTIPESAPFGDVIKWKLSRNPQRKEKRKDTFQLQVQSFNDFSKKENNIVWLGHSSFLIAINGINLITDPCFFDLPTSKRKVALPCPVDSLKSIDYLLISHDHRDHFDKKSVEALIANNPYMEALIPLGGNRFFEGKNLNITKKQEAGWYQEYNLTDSIRIIFLPAKHWGRRGLSDFNKTLWGSFLIIGKHTTIFFAGDSAYDEQIFQEIHNLFGNVDVCLLPIGAYSPQFLMKNEHMNPEEAVKVFSILDGKCFIPMHYGTYDLSDEPLGEPIKRLRTAASYSGLTDKIKELSVGEKYYLNNMQHETE